MKKYLEETKRSLKFKLAGPGHKLTESSNSNQPSSSKTEEPPKRIDSKESQEQRSAVLAAALQRTQGPKKNEGLQNKKKSAPKNSTIESSTRETEDNVCKTNEEEKESAPGVFFKCTAIDENIILPKPEWNEKIRTHILELKETDQVLASILQIKSLNSESEADECISLIIRYLRNIIDNPDNEKYRSIRMGNPKFSEKVLSVEGALDFFIAIGFEKEEPNDSNGDAFLKFQRETPADFESLIDSLLNINGLQLELYRDFQVFEPKDVPAESSALPDDFFEITVAELKRQQQQRTRQLERDSMLMTKKMRELERLKNAPRKALFTRIRVRLPNDHVIQGTFSVKEPFSSLRNFINDHLRLDSEYTIMSPPSHTYAEQDDDKTFEELNLQPAVQLFLKTSAENIEIVN